MDDTIKKKIIQIRKKHCDMFRFFADFEDDVYIAEDNAIMPEHLVHDNCDILKELTTDGCVDENDIDKLINMYSRIIQETKEDINMNEISVNVNMTLRDGNSKEVSILCYLDRNDDGLIVAYVGTLRILRKSECEIMEIVRAFSNDKNPSIFINRIAAFQNANPDRKYAYIQFDICNFKYINEKYGSESGDCILQYIAETLNIMCDDNHLHCRLTADIFQIVTYYNSKEEIEDFINMIDKKLCMWKNIPFTMAYGVNVVDGINDNYRKSGDAAGLARVKSKKSVIGRITFYEEPLMENVKTAGAIEEAEYEALKNGEFHVFLQPKYSYDKKHAEIVGAEALVRWIDKDGRIKPPSEFIPVFEKNGFIFKLDCYMWECVCKIIRSWIDSGKQPVPVSVNVSRSYLKKVDVAAYLKELVGKYQIPIEYFQVEITETCESEETLEYAKRMKEAGFVLMMDDFGSGYSSLNMLKDTPFDVLKMDRFFLDECLENDNGRTIVSYVISMANDLGLEVVAEGVETRDVADFLCERGCDVLQGFYFSKPVPLDVFEKLKEN